MMSKSNAQRRANLRRSIGCHRSGDPAASPLVSLRFVAWNAGMRRAAKIGKKRRVKQTLWL